MIELRNKDANNYFLDYTGELCDKFILLRELAFYSNEIKRIDENRWIINKDIGRLLEDKFNTQQIIEPYESIGQGLKYDPYMYQKEIVHFAMNHDNSLVVSPTGSGKTMIMIALYNELRLSNKINTPGIIVVPASLKYQWTKEVSKFSNYTAKAIDSPSKMGKKFDAQFEDCDLFICNYEVLKNKSVADKLFAAGCEFIAADEIQYIKSYKAVRSKALYEFNQLPFRYGFTATPITKNPEDIFGIFNFVDKDLFKTHGKFASNYIIYKGHGRVAGAKNVDHLKKQISPYMFIKTEAEISDQLPELIVTPIYIPMDKKTAKINTEIMEDLKKAQDAVDAIEAKIKDPKLLDKNKEYLQWSAKVMAYQTFAQELADDPRLLNMSESTLSNQYDVDGLKNPKLETLIDLVSDIIDADETVCIFTRYERMQQLLMNELKNKFDCDIAYINGSMSAEERYEQAYTLFQDTDSYKILIMTNAGQAGISLSKCKNLIEYDLADSYANQIQRHGRIKRADSVSRISNVKQLILDDSYDKIAEKIITKKRNYDADIIQSLKEDN
jgi:SNF2 family DNA or RNA helicase